MKIPLEHIERNRFESTRPLFIREVSLHTGTIRGRVNNADEWLHSKLKKLINKTFVSFKETLHA